MYIVYDNKSEEFEIFYDYSEALEEYNYCLKHFEYVEGLEVYIFSVEKKNF